MTTITAGDVEIVPDLIMSHQDEILGGSIIHAVPGRIYPPVTLRAATAPTGTLRLFFLDATAAQAARDAHLAAVAPTIADESMPWLPQRYVMTRLSRIQQETNGKRWVLEVGYQEIAP